MSDLDLDRTVIRRANLADLDDIADVKTRAARHAFAPLLPPAVLDRWVGDFCARDYLKRGIAGPAVTVVAEEISTTRIVGAAAMYTATGSADAYLSGGYLLATGRGIGSAMLASRIGYATQQHATRAHAYTFTGYAAAEALLTTFGFARVGLETLTDVEEWTWEAAGRHDLAERDVTRTRWERQIAPDLSRRRPSA